MNPEIKAAAGAAYLSIGILLARVLIKGSDPHDYFEASWMVFLWPLLVIERATQALGRLILWKPGKR